MAGRGEVADNKAWKPSLLGMLGLLGLLLAGLASAPRSVQEETSSRYREWKTRGGTPENLHYSALDQINRTNVHRLQVAWTYDTGDADPDSEMQCTPIVVEGLLYATSPKLRVFALDAATGRLRWSFDPFQGERVTGKLRNRGVTFWQDGEDRRILFTARHYLYALDARTGVPVAEFGDGGRVDLREGLGREVEGLSVGASSPGVVYKDLLILGSTVSEALPAAPGHIRAYDARNGQIRWIFHTIPQPGEFGYESWPPEAWQYIGGANCWAGMSVDLERGLVFCPTGSAAFDFYGANRVGDNLFANTLLALDAATGERVWHFQAVRHDVWDRDFPAPPSLVTVRRQGERVDAVAQVTKSGHILLLERETGESLFPIEDRPVPPSDVPGEVLARTQPFPLWPPPFARQRLTEEQVTRRTPEARRVVLERLRKLRNQGPFTPPSREGTVVFPGFDGGGEWGGGAFDPETGVFYVNSNEMAWILRLVERPPAKGRTTGQRLYMQQCAHCHLDDFSGSPPEFPDLRDLSQRRTPEEVLRMISQGSGRMPGFAHLGEEALKALSDFLLFGLQTEVVVDSETSPIELRYTHDGYNKFLDPDGYPAVEPPWGTLSAYDLTSGEILWKIPFGEFPELVEQGMRNTGSENYGGGVVTAGGLLFIGATNHDRKFRALDKTTGAVLWETVLPAAGNATPAVYEVSGRQFVVIAAGGGKWGLPSGGSYVAFALSEPSRQDLP